MRKYFFALCMLLIICTSVFPNPSESIHGALQFTEQIHIYFDSELNALNWIKTQTNFVSKQEATEAHRKIVASSLLNFTPEFANIVRLSSDFFVMISRTSTPGSNNLLFFVKGELVRLWQY